MGQASAQRRGPGAGPTAPPPDGPAGDGAAGPVAFVLALTLLLTPALGVPDEGFLQDSFKSLLVALGAWCAALVWAWQVRRHPVRPAWHPLLWFPLGLMAHALLSMGWSHSYLAGVEAVRWAVFAVLLAVGLQCLGPHQLPKLAFGVHWGAFAASAWGLAQFGWDLQLFPQGPNPASTFVNRNFAAEWVVCALPFSAFLLLQARQGRGRAVQAISLGVLVVFVMATGTRSALLALALLAGLVPVAAWRFRRQWAGSGWTGRQRGLVLALLAATVLGLGSLPTGNRQLLAEHHAEGRGLTPLARAAARTASLARPAEFTQGSFSLRWAMWQATGRMVADHPLSGVGAGAWEVWVPLYQAPDAALETDFYVHNEFLQLLAEYGLVGWLALLGLAAALGRAGWRTWRADTPQAQAEGPGRCTAWLSLLALMVVSAAGFPWRLAATGALFALCLAVLAASDLRLRPPRPGGGPQGWPRWAHGVVVAASLAGLGLTGHIGWQALRAEQALVRAVKLALTIGQSERPDDPRWNPAKAELLVLLREGIAIHPHYRKITPMAADEMARWGDWQNAVWVWESVAASRPHVPALLINIARAHAQLGQTAQAMDYLERSRRLQPQAPVLCTLEVALAAQAGDNPAALHRARGCLAAPQVDRDLTHITHRLALAAKDWPLAIAAMERLNRDWPAQQTEGWLRIAAVRAHGLQDEAGALAAYRAALASVPVTEQARLRSLIPPAYQARL